MSALAVRCSDQWGRHFHTIKAAETNNEEKTSQVAEKDRPCVCSCPHALSLFISESYTRMKEVVKAAVESMRRKEGKRRNGEKGGQQEPGNSCSLRRNRRALKPV